MPRSQFPSSLLSATQQLAHRAATVATKLWPKRKELPALLQQLDCQALKNPGAGFADELAESAGYIVAAALAVFKSAADQQGARRCERTARELQAFA